MEDIVSLLTNGYSVAANNPLVLVQYNTFCSIFGAPTFPINAANTAAALQRAQFVLSVLTFYLSVIVADILDTFQTIKNNVLRLNVLDIEIFCDSKWLTLPDPKNPSNFWDTRPTRPNPEKNGWIVIEGGTCNGATAAFTMAQIWGAPTDVITYCDNYFTSTWIPQDQSGQTLGKICLGEATLGTSFESVVGDQLAATVVHEFTHSVLLVGPSPDDPFQTSIGT
jgi:hypothetical protein